MKKANIINKIKGILIILIGLLLAAAGVWLYSKIWGTNLLFTDSSLGKVAKFYWIFLIAAVIVVVLGVCKFKKRVAAEPEQEAGDQTGAQDIRTQPEAVSTRDVQTQPNAVSAQDAQIQPDAAPAKAEVQDVQKAQAQSAEETELAVKADQAKEEAEPAAKEEKTSKKSFLRKKTGSTCPNCGKPISKGNKFCTSCGHKLD